MWGGTVGGEGGPLTAPRTVLGGPNIPPWTVRGDKYSAVDGPGGPILGGTNYRVTGLSLLFPNLCPLFYSEFPLRFCVLPTILSNIPR